MPRSCKVILDCQVHKGVMSQEDHDKIVRGLDRTWIVKQIQEEIDECYPDDDYWLGYVSGLRMALKIVQSNGQERKQV